MDRENKIHWRAGILALALIAFASGNEKERFGGVGLTVAQLFDQESKGNRGDLVVLDIMENSPAVDKNIKSGDIITHIDGKEVKGEEFGSIILKRLRGEIGSLVEITIKRPRETKPLSVKLKRSEITHQG
jgi:carboxyl-terminal processing protease